MKQVVFYFLDAEKGEGVDLAKKYKIIGYPTFILTNSEGSQIDRWLGYSKDHFLESLGLALADLSTIDEKTSRFNAQPNFADAVALGRYNASTGEYKQAVEFYTRAQQLNEDKTTDYAYEIFNNIALGLSRDYFSYEDAINAAHAVFASTAIATELLVHTARTMSRIARQNDRLDDMAEYLQKGLDVSADSDEAAIQRYHNLMLTDFSLYITGDTANAVESKKASMKEGWTEDANSLNSFAWWCYENLVNLEEAETLARRAVELSEPGSSRAMILDTAAQICKARGKIEDAIKLMELAIAEDPDNEQWSETLESFKNPSGSEK